MALGSPIILFVCSELIVDIAAKVMFQCRKLDQSCPTGENIIPGALVSAADKKTFIGKYFFATKGKPSRRALTDSEEDTKNTRSL